MSKLAMTPIYNSRDLLSWIGLQNQLKTTFDGARLDLHKTIEPSYRVNLTLQDNFGNQSVKKGPSFDPAASESENKRMSLAGYRLISKQKRTFNKGPITSLKVRS